jgi:hypothetical protein
MDPKAAPKDSSQKLGLPAQHFRDLAERRRGRARLAAGIVEPAAHRLGDKHLTSSATGRPASPTIRKAVRQLSSAPASRRRKMPSAEPIGMPSEKKASARARRAFGKKSAISE